MSTIRNKGVNKMSRSNNLYTMMKLSYDLAEDDYARKKTNSLLDSYKRYHKENLRFESSDPESEIRMFLIEDQSQQSII